MSGVCGLLTVILRTAVFFISFGALPAWGQHYFMVSVRKVSYSEHAFHFGDHPSWPASQILSWTHTPLCACCPHLDKRTWRLMWLHF